MNEITFDQNDVNSNKTLVLLTCILCIFVPILFFLPLVATKDSAYGKYYANQTLLLLLGYIAVTIVNIIPILGQIVWIVGMIALLVFYIMNAVNASKGIGKPVPFIGNFQIIK